MTKEGQQDSTNVSVGSGVGKDTTTATTYRTREKRSTRGSDVKMVNTRQAQRLSDGEEKAEVLRQRERKITHIMAYVAYNAKLQHAILIYNT